MCARQPGEDARRSINTVSSVVKEVSMTTAASDPPTEPLSSAWSALPPEYAIPDDLGDEVGDTAASLQLLDQWETELNACYDGLHTRPRHPVFVALAETVRKFEIPKHEFSDLLIAFRQDQSIRRYETFNDLLGYCRYSANPVGHLVLYLCGYRDVERQQLSDYTCTALQLANFWQDVSADFAKGRIYLPLEDLRRYSVSEQDLAHSRNFPAFCEMMKF